MLIRKIGSEDGSSAPASIIPISPSWPSLTARLVSSYPDQELGPALREALKESGPVLIEVPIPNLVPPSRFRRREPYGVLREPGPMLESGEAMREESGVESGLGELCQTHPA